MKRVLVLATLACMALAACDKGEQKPSGDTPAATASAATPSAATTVAPAAQTTPAQFADNDLATPVDFEDEAAETISAKTFKTDLTDLEKEIAKD
jgi:hypothetical protein